MSEVRVVDLTELGVNKEVFDKIYSMGEQDGRVDAIDEFSKAVKGIYFESEIDEMLLNKILEQLKENK